MKIIVDTDVLNKYNLSPNEYFYLHGLFKGEQIVTTFEQDIFYGLEKEGFVKVTDEGVILREKAIKLFLEGEATNSVSSWIDKWRELFPVGVKSGGYAVRGDRQSCTKKMKAFIKNHPEINLELIFDATKAYIDDRRKNRWEYIKVSHYFIEKDGVSMLASLCEDLESRAKNKTSFGVEVEASNDDAEFTTFV